MVDTETEKVSQRSEEYRVSRNVSDLVAFFEEHGTRSEK